MCVIGRKSKRAQPRLHGITPGLHDSYIPRIPCVPFFSRENKRGEREKRGERGEGGTKRIENNCSTSDSIVPSYEFRARALSYAFARLFHPFVRSSTQ